MALTSMDTLSMSIEELKKAAEQGEVEAQAKLGFKYGIGDGVEKDMTKAFNWYQKAAEQGHAIAQKNLACCYRDGNGVKQDSKKAADWFRKAAENGASGAQEALDKLEEDDIF